MIIHNYFSFPLWNIFVRKQSTRIQILTAMPMEYTEIHFFLFSLPTILLVLF